MYIKTRCNLRRGWTLIETMVAVGLFSIGAAALGAVYLYSIKAFAAMANYTSLDAENRQAMDQLTQEIRQAQKVLDCTSGQDATSITLLNAQTQQVTYLFSAAHKQFRRMTDVDSKILLTNCDLLKFELFQRNPSNGNYGVFPIASGDWTQSVKVIQLTWKTSRTLPNGLANSENIQTARIVIRKQHQ